MPQAEAERLLLQKTFYYFSNLLSSSKNALERGELTGHAAEGFEFTLKKYDELREELRIKLYGTS